MGGKTKFTEKSRIEKFKLSQLELDPPVKISVDDSLKIPDALKRVPFFPPSLSLSCHLSLELHSKKIKKIKNKRKDFYEILKIKNKCQISTGYLKIRNNSPKTIRSSGGEGRGVRGVRLDCGMDVK